MGSDLTADLPVLVCCGIEAFLLESSPAELSVLFAGNRISQRHTKVWFQPVSNVSCALWHTLG